MTSGKLPNRWGIALAAVLMQICLGAIYGWSVFKKPLMSAGHWTETAVQLNFTLAIFLTGAGAISRWLVAGQGRAAQGGGNGRRHLWYWLYGGRIRCQPPLPRGLYLGYGVLAGFGMGMGYICPVATLVKWFPDRRGLMTGVAVCGYGAGALVMSPLAAREILAYGVPATFLTLGIVYLVVVVLTAQFYQNPPQGWRPEGWEPRSAVSKAASTYDFTVKEAMSTPQFWLLWFMLFLNVSAGIMVISQASPMAQQLVGTHARHRRGNRRRHLHLQRTGPRLLGRVSDFLGRARVYFLLYLIQVGVFFALPHLHTAALFTAAVALRRSLLWRRLRHHAFIYRGLLRRQVHGRNLRLYPAGLGRSGSLAHPDRPCPADHGSISRRSTSSPS